MVKLNPVVNLYSSLIVFSLVLLSIFSDSTAANAHPLGNFTINHFAQLHFDADQVTMQYVVDMAEIPAFQALQIADVDGDRITATAELQAYFTQITPHYIAGLALQVDRQTIPLVISTKTISLPPGAGGLATMRLEWRLIGKLPATQNLVRELDFQDHNDRTRIGWREIVVDPTSPLHIFNSSAYSNSLTNALRAYPGDLLTTPLQESAAHLAFTHGDWPSAAIPLRDRAGQAPHRPGLTLLTAWQALASNNYQRLPLMPAVSNTNAREIAIAIAAAFVWGALHSMTPGHGKTLVGAYLIGTKATPKHALLLALTTTITHTIGVFALGLITLFAAEYVLPEQLYPWLSLASGIMVIAIGGKLFTQRWQMWRSQFMATPTIPTLNPEPNLHHSSHDHSSHFSNHHPSHHHSHKQEEPIDLAIVTSSSMPKNPHPLANHSFSDQRAHCSAQLSVYPDSLFSATAHPLTLDPTCKQIPNHKHTHNHECHHDQLLDRNHSSNRSHNHVSHHHYLLGHSHKHSQDHPHDPNYDPSSHHHLPGADGLPVTWQSLLALGISGGLMPCPAALVLLLGAIGLRQVSFGLILV